MYACRGCPYTRGMGKLGTWIPPVGNSCMARAAACIDCPWLMQDCTVLCKIAMCDMHDVMAIFKAVNGDRWTAAATRRELL